MNLLQIFYNFSTKNLFLFALFLLILAYLYSNFHENKNQIKNVKDLSKDFNNFQIYVDRYYIKNIYCNFFFIFLYFILLFGIVIILRIVSLGSFTEIRKNDVSISLIYNFISYNNIITFITFLFLLISYKTLINILFYREFLKAHIYFHQFSFYDKITNIITLRFTMDIGRKIECFLWYISCDDLHEPQYSSNFDFMLDDFKALHLANKIRFYCSKSKIITYIFQNLHKITSYTFSGNEINYIFYRIIFIIIMIIGSHEFLERKLDYFYYLLFFLLLINLLWRYNIFLTNKSTMYDFILSQYFYNNSKKYQKIRTDVFSGISLSFNQENSDQTNRLLDYYTHAIRRQSERSIINYAIDNLKLPLEDKIREKMIFRMSVIIIIGFFIYFNALSYMMLFGLWFILLIILALLLDQSKYYFIESYFDKPKLTKHNLYFWMLLFLELFLIIKLIIIPNLVFLDNEILLDWGIKIYHIYTKEDKNTYFWEFFNYMANYRLSIEDQIYLKNIINQLDLSAIINDKITLIEIKEFIINLIEIYKQAEMMEFYCIYLHVIYIEELESYLENARNNPINELVNIIIIHTLISFLKKSRKMNSGIKTIKFVQNHFWMLKELLKLLFKR